MESGAARDAEDFPAVQFARGLVTPGKFFKVFAACVGNLASSRIALLEPSPDLRARSVCLQENETAVRGSECAPEFLPLLAASEGGIHDHMMALSQLFANSPGKRAIRPQGRGL